MMTGNARATGPAKDHYTSAPSGFTPFPSENLSPFFALLLFFTVGEARRVLS
ncbi:MAG: hypothetical protein ACYC5N_07805 [Endomicrobiales bacterium]